MDKVGVDGAIYISPFSMYQYDGSYAVSVQHAHPGKFALVKPVNPDDPVVADVIADWKNTPGTVGIRIILTKESKRAPDDPGLDRIMRAAVKSDFPVNVLFWGNVDAGTALIDRHPDARFIIDHMGIQQPNVPPAPAQPWADLPKVVELAKRKNAVIKITGARRRDIIFRRSLNMLIRVSPRAGMVLDGISPPRAAGTRPKLPQKAARV
jgi:predicted TIM-barrel fold metal-dependent hydrolase